MLVSATVRSSYYEKILTHIMLLFFDIFAVNITNFNAALKKSIRVFFYFNFLYDSVK